MTPSITIREALSDPQLLGNALPGDTWSAWRTLLIASMGESLTDEERAVFKQLTGREREPGQRVEEAAFVIGRRGGKSRAMSALAVYLAALNKHRLVGGERGVVLAIAPDQRQARIVLEYCADHLEQSPILRQLVVNRNSEAIELSNRISIEVRAASFRRLRGPTYVAVFADEAAFWHSDEISANADAEILAAVRPGLATTGGPLIIASSPHARHGELWQTYRRHFGPAGDPLIMVAQGTSRDLNPSLPQSVVDRALERDRAKNTAEYLAQFRTDVESFVSYEVVQQCVGGHVELPPMPGVQYHGFVDPSGGSSDSFTLAISHSERDQVIVDCVREVRPPFSPDSVIDEFATLLKSYRIGLVRGDRYGGEFPRELFRKRGISYGISDKPKSALYQDMLPLLNSGRIVLPKNERLVNQLCGLERKVSRSGRDSIDHGDGLHDDLANVVAGAADRLATRPTADTIMSDGFWPDGSQRWFNFTKQEYIRPAGKAPPPATYSSASAPCTIDFSKINKPAPKPADGFTSSTSWITPERG
jgi:hypothetical protein